MWKATQIQTEAVKHRRCLRCLIIGHIVAGIACATIVDINKPPAIVQSSINGVFTALIGSELCLLGLGAAATAGQTVGWHLSLRGIAGLTSWLWLLTITVLGRSKPAPPPFIILLAPMVSVAACAFGLALRKSGIRLVHSANSGDAQEAFQFTLRHLLALTGAVAMFLAIGRALRDSPTIHQHKPIAEGFVVLTIGIVTASIVVTTLWAALGASRPVQRLPVAIALAGAAGLLPAYYFKVTPLGHFILAAVAAALSVITSGSLLVVRRAGFRLVRRPRPPGATNEEHLNFRDIVDYGDSVASRSPRQ